MSVINHKIWSDLWHNKGRTLQIVLIIAMGAFAIGMIIGSSGLMREGMTDVWLSSSPAMINLGVDPAIDDNTLESLKNIRGVVDVEGYIETTIEWRLKPTDEWKPAGLIARDDYEEQTFAKLSLVSGNWPKEKVFAVEQGADAAFDIQEGGQIYIRVDDREYKVKIGGTIYNPTARPPALGGNAQFYATRDRVGQITEDRDFNRIAASAPVFNETAVTALADRMDRHLEKLDIEAFGAEPGRISDSNKHYFQDTLDGSFLVMGIMAALALILGLFLVYNTVNALIAQQVSQIGMMKAIGARTGQILRIYLSLVFIHGLLALLVAVPLGAIGAYQYMFGDLLFSILRYDVSLLFDDSERIQRIEAITLAQPEVKAVEMWGLADAPSGGPTGPSRTTMRKLSSLVYQSRQSSMGRNYERAVGWNRAILMPSSLIRN